MNLPFIDVLQKIAATFALFVGAVWVLMNYLRNRTHVPRLQIDLKAEMVEARERHLLLVTVQVKNVGLSMIHLPAPTEAGGGPKGSALLVAPLSDYAPDAEIIDAVWEDVHAFEVLESHRAIEPGLTLTQQKLIRLPDRAYDAIWVRLRVLAHHQSWSAIAVAVPPPSTK